MRRKRLFIALLVMVAVVAAGTFVAGRMLGSDAVRTALERQLSQRLGQPVHITSASVAFFPRVAVDLHGVSIGPDGALDAGRLRFVTGLRPLLSRIVSDAEVVVDGARVRLPLPFAFGADSAASAAAAPGSAPLVVTSIRQLSLQNVSLIAGAQTIRLDAECSVDGDRLNIERLTAQGRTTRIQAHGTLTSISGMDGSLTATADPLDLDEIIVLNTALASTAPAPRSTAAANPLHLRVVLTTPIARFAVYELRDLSTTIDMVPGRLSFSPLDLRAFGGKFSGRLEANTSQAIPELQLSGRMDGIDVVEVLKAGGAAGGITGRLSGAVSLTGNGADAASLLRTSRGTISAAVADGAMPHLDMVRPIVLAFGKPSGAPPPGSGSSFSRLGGTFALAGGVLTSEDLAMDARDFDLAGKGSLRLQSGAVSARTDVVLSEELTAQAGTDLRRYAAEGKRVVVPATIAGTLQQPTVSLDIAAATRRALGNELQRRAKSFLDGLFKKRDAPRQP
jgi:uncharacterized protein involved in outer membrane biogenesis